MLPKNVAEMSSYDVDPISQECGAGAKLNQAKHNEDVPHRDYGRNLRKTDVDSGYEH
jgi:hypothetical protein